MTFENIGAFRFKDLSGLTFYMFNFKNPTLRLFKFYFIDSNPLKRKRE